MRKYLAVFGTILIFFVAVQIFAGGDYTVRMEYDANDNPIYIGRAEPGTGMTESYWQIKRLTYDGSGNCTRIEYANGDNGFKFRWSSRAVYNYS